MPKTVDISEDELDTEGGAEGADEGAEEGQEGKDKQKPGEDTAAASQAAIARLTQQVQQLSQNLGKQSAAANEKEISKSEEAIKYLLGSGYKPEQLEAVVTLLQAAREDITKDLESKYSKKEQEKGARSLDEKCFERANEVIGRLLKNDPLADDDDYRQMVTSKIQKTMEKGDFEAARAAYGQGKPPSEKDFEKAARLVLQSLGKEVANNMRDNSNPQLDVKNSRPTTHHPAISKTGDVDKTKLNDYELEVYTTALNATKNKEIALHALRTIGSRGR